MRSGALLTTIFLLTLGLFSPTSSYAQCSTTASPASSNCASFGDGIDKVTINGVSTTSGSTNGCSGSNGHGVYTAPVFKLVPGQSNSISALLGSGTESEGFAIFIDLDNNGYFNGSNEIVYQYGTSGTSISGTFTIPTTGVTTGTQLVMRMRAGWLHYPWAIGDACASIGYGYGETEDYTVILCPPVAVTTHPSDSAACEGTNASFTVATNSTGVTYQWQYEQPGSNGYVNVVNNTNFSGATSGTLSITNIPPSLDGSNFRCIINSTCNTNLADTSTPALLAVSQNVNITNQPTTDTTCEGLNVAFDITATGNIISYTWQKYVQGSGWVTLTNTPPYSGVTTKKLQMGGVVDTLNGALFRCIVGGECVSDTTDSITLGVNSIPKVINHPTNVSVIQGSDANFSVIAAGQGVAYRWQAGVNGTFSNINNQSIYSGVNTANLTVSGVTEAQSGFQFRCIIQGSGGCAAEPDTSTTAILNVLPPLGIGNITKVESSIYPNPVSGTTINVTVNYSGKSNLKYKVISSVGQVVVEGDMKNNQGYNTEISVEGLNAGIYTVQITDDNNNNVETMKFTKI